MISDTPNPVLPAPDKPVGVSRRTVAVVGGVAAGVIALGVAIGVYVATPPPPPPPSSATAGANAPLSASSPSSISAGSTADSATNTGNTGTDDDATTTAVDTGVTADSTAGASDSSASPSEPTVEPADGVALKPWPADDEAVQALLELAAFRDYDGVLELIDGYEDEQAWELVAGALLAADSVEVRALMAQMLAGKFPESAWMAEADIFAAATAELFAQLLLANPEWLIPAGAGYVPFQRALLDLLLTFSVPLPLNRRGWPAGFAALPASAFSVESARLADLLGALRQMDDLDLREKLFGFVGRCGPHATGESTAALAPALWELSGLFHHEPRLQAAALAAMWMIDTTAGESALLDALAHSGHRHAALLALESAWNQARQAPSENLVSRVIELATTVAAPPTADGFATTTQAVELLQGWLQGRTVVNAEHAKTLAARAEEAAFGAGSAGGGGGGDSAAPIAHQAWIAAQMQLVATLRADDAELVPRLLTAIGNGQSPTASAAVAALGSMNAASAIDALMALAKNPAQTVAVRRAAVASLANRVGARPGQIHDTLRELATSGTPAAVRADAATAWGKTFGSRAETIDSLRRIAETDAAPAVRAAAIFGLAHGCSPARALEMHEFFGRRRLDDPASAVRNAADSARTVLHARTGIAPPPGH